MSVPEDSMDQALAEDFAGTWRYKIGLGLIIIGHLVLVSGLLLPLLGLGSAGLTGALVVSGEIVSLTSIVFLGKAGFLAIKSKVLGFVKSGYAGPVGPVRHYVGVVLLCAHIVTGYLMALYAWDVFAATSPADPIPEVWGLGFGDQRSMYFTLFLLGELAFLVAIYVLGADWWERFRRIFVWEAAREIEPQRLRQT